MGQNAPARQAAQDSTLELVKAAQRGWVSVKQVLSVP